MDKIIFKIIKAFDNSEYHIAATGFRDISDHELYTIIRIFRMNNIDYSKELHGLYKYAPDRRNYPEYFVWRDSVFERDDYTCQNCGKRGGTLNAHHILSYKNNPDERISVDNGVTLCEGCHRREHKKQ
jgi:hypothetical protein